MHLLKYLKKDTQKDTVTEGMGW